jgi:mannitol/fructose-specific phosphotransferase system IIA component (Ntr-type)
LAREPVIALGRSKQKINFDALDGQSVGLVILFLVPPLQFQKHLQTMVEFSKHLQQPDIYQALMQAPDAGTMLQIIMERKTS